MSDQSTLNHRLSQNEILLKLKRIVFENEIQEEKKKYAHTINMSCKLVFFFFIFREEKENFIMKYLVIISILNINSIKKNLKKHLNDVC
jgi:hypothetical protein